ncbi:hypothetical protein DFH09DRAFT_837593, partial [Mycena vulgaris]
SETPYCIRNVREVLTIAHRTTSPLNRRPHQVNKSGVGRQNCGCVECRRDRVELGCKNPGECIESARALLNAIFPKWNPTSDNGDLCDALALTEDEQAENSDAARGQSNVTTFDPDFRLREFHDGYRIF